MSTSDAIHGVSDTLRRLLRDRMHLPAGFTCPVTVGAPRSNLTNQAEAGETARVNLFLYRTQHNAALRNQDVPGRGHPGGPAVPPLSLDLFYLLTAYGTTDDAGVPSETQAHKLLGSAMRVFHDHAILTDRLRTVRSSVVEPILAESLRDEFERVKITPEPLALEDLSKLWTALTLPLRASAAYQVSVVQIDSRQPRRSAPLVLEPPAGPQVFAVVLPRPVVTRLGVRRPTDAAGTVRPVAFVRAGDTLVIDGEQLAGEAVVVRVGPAEFPLGRTTDPARIELPFTPPPDLPPGAHAVEVVVGLSGAPGPGAVSNQAVVMFVPRVDAVTLLSGRRLQLAGDRVSFPGRGGQVSVGDVSIPQTPAAATPSLVTVSLPDTLPAADVTAVVSGGPITWAALPVSLKLSVSVGGGTARPFVMSRPSGAKRAAELLEEQLHEAGQAGQAGVSSIPASPPLLGARVTATADGRLVVVAGGLTDSLTFGGADAAAVGLTTGAEARVGYLSGVCDPLPPVSSPAPEVTVTIGGTPRVVLLSPKPTDIGTLAARLEAGIGGGSGTAFTAARVVVVGTQVLIVSGTTAAVRVGPTANDSRSAEELRLAVRLPVRVRVGGAESIDDKTYTGV